MFENTETVFFPIAENKAAGSDNYLLVTLITAFLLLFFWGPSAYASGRTSAVWLILLSPYWTL
jgi:hypothetical protein